MSIQHAARYTVEEYLALERSTREKYQYFAGEVFAMGGASEAHNLIVANSVATLHSQHRGKPCRVYPSDLRVKVNDTGLYTYPDAIVVCGEPRFEQPGETLLNPTLLVEVLSESSESYDRGKKWEHYRNLSSLTDYVLIAQDRVSVEHFSRLPDERWLLQAANALDAVLEISSLGVKLAMREVYLNVEGIEGARPSAMPEER